MELGLGTAQFGFDYGVSNSEGKVPFERVRRLLEKACENGVRVLDTASTYGDSETVLGRATGGKRPFRIVTKVPPVKREEIRNEDLKHIRKTVEGSIERLRVEQLAGLLMHWPDDLLSPGGEGIYELMQTLKARGTAEKIGVSVHGVCGPIGEEIDRLFGRYDFDMIQLPLNVLDQELIHDGHIAALKKRNVEIHVRSVFLQGLLLMPVEDIDPYFAPLVPVLRNYRRFLDEHGLSPVEAALGFVRDFAAPDVVLVGVTNEEQLMTNIRALGVKPLGHLDFGGFAVGDRNMVNPNFWRLEEKPRLRN